MTDRPRNLGLMTALMALGGASLQAMDAVAEAVIPGIRPRHAHKWIADERGRQTRLWANTPRLPLKVKGPRQPRLTIRHAALTDKGIPRHRDGNRLGLGERRRVLEVVEANLADLAKKQAAIAA
jgi:hypothetical protein